MTVKRPRLQSLTKGNFKTAMASVRATKGRTFLTMLGIVIGVVSVVSIVSIGEGVKRQVNSQIDHLGKDLITIRPGYADPGAAFGGVNLLTPTLTGALSRHDVDVIHATSEVKYSVPLSIVTGTSKGDHDYSGMVIGTNAELPAVLNQELDFGAFFTDDELNQNVAILGPHAAEKLFDSSVPLGHSFNFRGQKFLVRGIFKEFDSAPISVDTDFNDAIFVPAPAVERLTGNSAPIYEILAKPSSPDKTADVASAITHQLQQAHHGVQDFSVLRQHETLAATERILNLLTALIAGVAGISLVVGGIGVMNVMLVSVTERMHEIGVRKAVGATNRQILNQFVIESSVLSLLGGVLGIVVSLFVNLLLRIFTDLKPVISWPIVIAAVFVSLVVGVLFGSAPALKAARKDPINALRNE